MSINNSVLSYSPDRPSDPNGVFSKLLKIDSKINESVNIDIQQFLEHTAALKYEIELHKQKLVNECPEYNTIDAFRLIDVQG